MGSALAITQFDIISPTVDLPHQTITLTEGPHRATKYRSVRAATVTEPTDGNVTVTFEADTYRFFIEQRLTETAAELPLTDAVTDGLASTAAETTAGDLWQRLAQIP